MIFSFPLARFCSVTGKQVEGVNAAEGFYGSIIESHDHGVRARELQEHKPEKLRRHRAACHRR